MKGFLDGDTGNLHLINVRLAPQVGVAVTKTVICSGKDASAPITLLLSFCSHISTSVPNGQDDRGLRLVSTTRPGLGTC
jgi:hypothetical protein